MHYDMQAPDTNPKRALMAYNGCVYVFLTGLLTSVDHCFVSQDRSDLDLVSRSNPMLANFFQILAKGEAATILRSMVAGGHLGYN